MTTARPKATAKTAPTGLDLDTLERDGVIPEPYVFTLQGRQWTASDPAEVDWQTTEALDVDSAAETMAAYLGEEQYADFALIKLKSWKLIKLVDDIGRHYSPVDSPGEAGGSPTS